MNMLVTMHSLSYQPRTAILRAASKSSLLSRLPLKYMCSHIGPVTQRYVVLIVFSSM